MSYSVGCVASDELNRVSLLACGGERVPRVAIVRAKPPHMCVNERNAIGKCARSAQGQHRQSQTHTRTVAPYHGSLRPQPPDTNGHATVTSVTHTARISHKSLTASRPLVLTIVLIKVDRRLTRRVVIPWRRGHRHCGAHELVRKSELFGAVIWSSADEFG